jgi:hypothetical protein
MVFGMLTVLEKRPGGRRLVRCECGKEKEVTSGNLNAGNAVSCGCLAAKKEAAKPVQIFIGARFGSVTVTGVTEKGWVPIRCDCGETKRVTTGNLRIGNVVSCGPRCALKYDAYGCPKIGEKFGHLTVISLPAPRTARLLCECGNQVTETISVLRCGDRSSCGCNFRRYQIGDIINGRMVVELGTKTKSMKTKCLSCGSVAVVDASKKAKCRYCEPWDSRMKTGFVYGIVCPYTGDVRYVGSTRHKPHRRVIGHIRERKASGNETRPLYVWIREIISGGGMPGAIQLEHVETGNLHEREVFWIHKLSEDGASLFNSEHNDREEVT